MQCGVAVLKHGDIVSIAAGVGTDIVAADTAGCRCHPCCGWHGVARAVIGLRSVDVVGDAADASVVAGIVDISDIMSVAALVAGNAAIATIDGTAIIGVRSVLTLSASSMLPEL